MKYLFSLLVAMAMGLSTLPARAIPDTVLCSALDTSTSYATPLTVLMSACNVTTGANGILYVIANAQTNCVGTEAIRIFVVAGTAPTQVGSNPIGSIASGNMTVTGAGQGIFTPPFTIITGQNITGAGVTMTGTITGQTSTGAACGGLSMGVNGGCGVYTVSNGSLSLGSGSNFYGLFSVPGGATYMNTVVHQNACNNGFTITSLAGSFVGTPNTAYNLGMTIATNTLGNFTSWNNTNLAVVEY